jgi:hypothetical protein
LQFAFPSVDSRVSRIVVRCPSTSLDATASDEHLFPSALEVADDDACALAEALAEALEREELREDALTECAILSPAWL